MDALTIQPCVVRAAERQDPAILEVDREAARAEGVGPTGHDLGVEVTLRAVLGAIATVRTGGAMRAADGDEALPVETVTVAVGAVHEAHRPRLAILGDSARTAGDLPQSA